MSACLGVSVSAMATTGSYYVSALFFNVADLANQFLLPSTVFDDESVVSKLVNPVCFGFRIFGSGYSIEGIEYRVEV